MPTPLPGEWEIQPVWKVRKMNGEEIVSDPETLYYTEEEASAERDRLVSLDSEAEAGGTA